jgi:protein SCO1/2
MTHATQVRRRMANLRIAGAMLLAAGAGFFGAAGWPGPSQAETSRGGTAQPEAAPTLADYDVSKLTLGGDFTLTDTSGRRIALKSFRGRAVLMFFGYTYCPDVCPVTLATMARIKHALGAKGSQFQPLFITIDPERDTPARLKAYVANFEGGAIALRGTLTEIRHVADLYRARFEKEDPQATKDYLMGHTAYLYLLDGTGKLRYVFPPDVEDSLLTEAVYRSLGG